MSDENEEGSSIQVSEMFALSPWYSYIIYVLKNLSPPPNMTRNKARTLKLKAAKLCILNSALYWKDLGGVLLNCLVEKEAKKVMEDCHEGDCGGHLFWKSTANKVLRAGYYWPTLFADVYKMVKSCHKCKIFEGRQKLQPLPLKPIEMSPPFQQWGLDFIGEIHPASSDQHRWILTTTYYFMKWIKEIPTRQATDADGRICHKYHIILGHSSAYHPQGNGLAESSNKSLVNIIKKLLEINKKSWHKRLVNALWANRVSQKKSIGMSPFELVYEVDIVFPTSLVAPVDKLLQEAGSEDNPMQRRLNQMVHLQQTREEVFQNTSKLQEKIKKIYDRKAEADKFQLDDVVLKWDARNEEKGKHGKFENLWKGPFNIAAYRGQNAFLLKEMNGEDCPGGPINGRLLKWYHF
eukprot:PITA_06384